MNEQEMIRKEAVVAYLKYYSVIFVEGMRRTTKQLRIVGVSTETRTEYLTNTNPKCYREANLLSYKAPQLSIP
jgi:hypothetical protein